jgi:hypothetical protein
MGTAGRRRVEAHFEVGQMVAAYEMLYLGRERPAAGPSGPDVAALTR